MNGSVNGDGERPNFAPPDNSSGAWPIPADSIYFVDSPSSHEFKLFLWALDRASIVGMDAEWKPVRSRKAGTCPRVSIMQLACRLHHDGADEEPCDSQTECPGDQAEEGDSSCDNCMPADDGEAEWDLEQQEGVTVEGDKVNGDALSGDSSEGKSSTSHNEETTAFCHNITEELVDRLGSTDTLGSNTRGQSGAHGSIDRMLYELKDKNEVIFLLDMMSLPAWSFWEAMKRMLVSRSVLKLGFSFRQDLINLARSFPGPDAHSCFDKVDPYVDIGRLYHELRGYSSSHLINTVALESLSLATVCEKVVGYSLCKDVQCSNWEQRPLSSEQMDYAAADAYCLLVIHDALEIEATHGGCDLPRSAESFLKSARDGITELLLSDSENALALPHSLVPGSILHAYRGAASTMVRRAVAGGILVTSGLHTVEVACCSSAAHLWIAKQFGERLLVQREGSNALVKRRPKTHRGREGGKSKGVQQEVHSWSGPPPWDPCCGGDGSPKFLCDIMVEGLARQLRNVGIDTVCPRVQKSDPRKLVEQAEKEGRVLLTRDIKLLRRRLMPENLAYFVRSLAKQEQLAEVINTFHLTISEEDLLSRCTKCNGDFIPEPLSPEEALASVPQSQRIPEYAVRERLLFWQCSECHHMYWQRNQFHRALEKFQALARKIQVQVTQ